MPGPAVRCPACGHALFTVDEPAWPLRLPEPPPLARGEPEPAGRLLLRVAEAAELLAISRSSLYQLMSAGAVRTVRLGRTVRVPRREVERLAGGATRGEVRSQEGNSRAGLLCRLQARRNGQRTAGPGIRVTSKWGSDTDGTLLERPTFGSLSATMGTGSCGCSPNLSLAIE